MGRKLTFCKEETLKTAMTLFWQKGFDATSMRDVAAAADVPLASLYNAYGDKRSLFMDSLDCYTKQNVLPTLASLSAAGGDARQKLLDFFNSMVNNLQKEDPGCYLVQVAGQLKTTEPELSAAALERLDVMRAGLQNLVEEAQRQGSIAQNQSARELSEYLIGTMLAVKTWARAGVEKAVLQSYLSRALSVF
jgi:TetR/AcrR family transcriptional repressor of nem operon